MTGEGRLDENHVEPKRFECGESERHGLSTTTKRPPRGSCPLGTSVVQRSLGGNMPPPQAIPGGQRGVQTFWRGKGRGGRRAGLGMTTAKVKLSMARGRRRPRPGALWRRPTLGMKGGKEGGDERTFALWKNEGRILFLVFLPDRGPKIGGGGAKKNVRTFALSNFIDGCP